MAEVSDPLGVHGHRPKQANHSELLKAQAVARQTGHTANLCPFGCTSQELDDFGYCRHLIGFTQPQNPKQFETFMPPDKEDGMRRRVDGKQIRPVKPGDVVVPISSAAGSRVYRDVDLEQMEEATRPGGSSAALTQGSQAGGLTDGR